MIVLLGVLLLAAVSRQDAPVSGQYIEDRTMRVYACPCEWSTDWANRGREAVLAWNVVSGEYRGASLAGLKIVAVIVGDFTLTERTTSRRSALFVDPQTPSDQRRAGLAWLESTYPAMLGEVAGVHVAPIDFVIGPDLATLHVEGAVSLKMRRAHFPEDTQSWAQLIHDPFIPLEAPAIGLTSHMSYTGPDLKTHWTRDDDALTGYFGNFTAGVTDSPAGPAPVQSPRTGP